MFKTNKKYEKFESQLTGKSGERVQRLVIPGSLPGMNEIIQTCTLGYQQKCEMMTTYTSLVQRLAYQQEIRAYDCQIDIHLTFYCKDKRRDKDNIIAGQKFIFDGLQKAEILKNDGWGDLRNLTYEFHIDKDFPRIEVFMKEAK